MTQEGARPGSTLDDPFAQIGSSLLRSALERAVDQWGEGSAVMTHEVIAQTLLEVGLATEADDEGVARLRTAIPGQLALWRLGLDHLRAEVLGAPWDGADAEPFEILRRMERVREAIEPDWNHGFASALLGPNGLGLALGVSHDLRSPLTSVLFLSEALRNEQNGELNEVQRRQAGLIYSAARSMLSTVNDVLEGGAPGEVPVGAHPTVFSLADALVAVQEILIPVAEQKGLAFEVSWEGPDPRRGHPVALSRALLNLAQNALKFTEAGRVELGAEEGDSGSIRFWVHDTGPGIPRVVQDRLYQTFRLMDGQQGLRFSASGLGLMVARTLIGSMGGHLDLESRPGRTKFSFTLELPQA